MFWILTKYVRELELQGMVKRKSFRVCYFLVNLSFFGQKKKKKKKNKKKKKKKKKK